MRIYRDKMKKYGNNQYLILVYEGNIIVRTQREYVGIKLKTEGYILIPGYRR